LSILLSELEGRKGRREGGRKTERKKKKQRKSSVQGFLSIRPWD
jgi:hypothetical protein